MRNQGSIGQSTTWHALEQLEPRRLLSVSWVPDVQPFERGLRDFEVADVNRDLIADVLLISGSLSVYIGHGDNTFQPEATYTFDSPREFSVADLDRDGILDIVVTEARGIAFRPGIGDGTFGSLSIFAQHMSANYLEVADLNGDGNNTVIVRSGAQIDFLRREFGSFSSQLTFSLHSRFDILAIIDMDGDGDLDLATYDDSANEFMTVFNNGSSFSAGPTLSLAFDPGVADFNNDGIADLVWKSPQGFEIALNTGNATFGAAQIALASTSAEGIIHQPLHLNGDGFPDLVTARFTPGQFFGITQQPGFYEIVAYVSDGNGGFTRRNSTFLGSEEFYVPDKFFFGDYSNDGFADVLDMSTGVSNAYRTLAFPPVFSDVVVPTGPVVAGTPFTVEATVVAHAGRTVTEVRVVSRLGLTASLQPTSQPNRWSGSVYFTDGQIEGSSFGTKSIRVVAIDSTGVGSDTGPITLSTWTRLFIPEGWRNDERIAEWLTIVNPNAEPTPYRVVVRYETGERDAVIAEGTLGALEQYRIILALADQPGAARVREGVGYAIEVQSEKHIGATLLHEDNFGLPGEADRVTNAEALNNQSANRWGFADVSTRGNDFLLFYNPFEQDIMLSVTFTHATLGSLVIWQPLDALRRGGLNLREIAALAADQDYAVEITSDDPFAAAISRYADSGGTGFTALGQRFGRMKTFNWVGLGAGESSSLVLFNPGAAAISVSIEMAFNDPLATVSVQQVTVAAGTRQLVSLASFAPVGTTAANMKLTSSAAFYSQATTTSTLFGDAAQTQSPNVQAAEWVFADALFRRGQSDEWLILTNNNSVTNRVTLSFIVNGVLAQRTLDIGVRQTIRINLNDEPTIRVGPDLSSYAIAVSGQFKLVASMVRWDPVGGVGWQTLGTITSPTTFL